MKRYKKRNIIRCEATGKIINGRKAIIAEKGVIIEYLKKMGYKIVPPIEMIAPKIALNIISLMVSVTLLMIPFISSAPYSPIFEFDFTDTGNQMILWLLFLLLAFFLYIKNYMLSGFIVIIGAILTIFNNSNPVVGIVLLGIGIIILFLGED